RCLSLTKEAAPPMAIAERPAIAAPAPVVPSDGPAHGAVFVERRGLGGWLTTVDHKKIGLMYMFTTLFFFLLGGILALLVRVQLALPQSRPFGGELYNQIFTMHATLMIFFFIIPMGVG